jgi:hypothetical protein
VTETARRKDSFAVFVLLLAVSLLQVIASGVTERHVTPEAMTYEHETE